MRLTPAELAQMPSDLKSWIAIGALLAGKASRAEMRVYPEDGEPETISVALGDLDQSSDSQNP
jgi:hypothetical protein